jgi:hypothetical protein
LLSLLAPASFVALSITLPRFARIFFITTPAALASFTPTSLAALAAIASFSASAFTTVLLGISSPTGALRTFTAILRGALLRASYALHLASRAPHRVHSDCLGRRTRLLRCTWLRAKGGSVEEHRHVDRLNPHSEWLTLRNTCRIGEDLNVTL